MTRTFFFLGSIPETTTQRRAGTGAASAEARGEGAAAGWDAAFGRAVAAAVGDHGGVHSFPARSASERLGAVQTGVGEVQKGKTTWTQSRDSSVGMELGPTSYYDGQQLMARV